MLTCILIDPFACEVRTIELPIATNKDDLAPYYAALSHESHLVSRFEAIDASLLRGRDAIFVGEAGMMAERHRYFIHGGWQTPLAGNGLIIGATGNGAPISAETPIDDVRRYVVFLERHGDRWAENNTPWARSRRD